MTGPARPSRLLRTRPLALSLLALPALLALVGCEEASLTRPDTPVVLTLSQVPRLSGADAGDIVAFRHRRPNGVGVWEQVPVQVDERKEVDFGVLPTATSVLDAGTVYGTDPAGVTALQYADLGTWVGADGDPTFDSDDELVFMSGDLGGVPLGDDPAEPDGVVPGSGSIVMVDDPSGVDERGWIFLYRADPAAATPLTPGAGKDYVSYDFRLDAGTYLGDYRHRGGANPEHSTASGFDANGQPIYTVGYLDRWRDTAWSIQAGGATGVDILDENHTRSTLIECFTSNANFPNMGGAFATNTDGPVRAIRSFVGAASGHYTQRTQVHYRDRVEVRTDLRVHEIGSLWDFVDYSTAALGMSYQSSTLDSAVTIDAEPDTVPPEVPTWELVTGEQGSVYTAMRVDASFLEPGDTLDDLADSYYRDEDDSDACVGDDQHLGASGLGLSPQESDPYPYLPNTDPRLYAPPTPTLVAVRTHRFAAPGATAEDAAAWAAALDAPLTTTVLPHPLPAPPTP